MDTAHPLKTGDSDSRLHSFDDDLRPVVILGAARSGTKFLRQIIGASSTCAPVPYGVNHVWRYGNQSHPHDALSPTHCTDRIARYIRRTLLRTANCSPPFSHRYLIEKTCANTLRVSFVDAVLPDALFIHIVRDGRDVVASARHQWRRRPSLLTRIKKGLSAPLASLQFGARQLAGRVRPGAMRTASTWGPRYPGIDDDVRTLTTVEVCAQQWKHCVIACLDALETLPSNRSLTIRYEELIATSSSLEALCSFLDLPDPSALHTYYHQTVRRDTTNRWKHAYEEHELRTIESILVPTLHRLGYEQTTSKR